MQEQSRWKDATDTVCEAGHYILCARIETKQLGRPAVVSYTSKMPLFTSILATSVKGQGGNKAASPPEQEEEIKKDRKSRVCDDRRHLLNLKWLIGGCPEHCRAGPCPKTRFDVQGNWRCGPEARQRM